MCGRYNFTVEQSDEIRDILDSLNTKLHVKAVKNGEIYPTDQMPILIDDKNEVSPILSKWGFPKFDGKGVIINARAESAFEKKIFMDSLLNRRCIIPSTGFYEWNSSKIKFIFQLEDTNTLYMAGIYNSFGGESRYTILTTDANESVADIHNRMPLVIPRQDIKTWIMDGKATGDLLHRIPPQLVRLAV